MNSFPSSPLTCNAEHELDAAIKEPVCVQKPIELGVCGLGTEEALGDISISNGDVVVKH